MQPRSLKSFKSTKAGQADCSAGRRRHRSCCCFCGSGFLAAHLCRVSVFIRATNARATARSPVETASGGAAAPVICCRGSGVCCPCADPPPPPPPAGEGAAAAPGAARGMHCSAEASAISSSPPPPPPPGVENGPVVDAGAPRPLSPPPLDHPLAPVAGPSREDVPAADVETDCEGEPRYDARIRVSSSAASLRSEESCCHLLHQHCRIILLAGEHKLPAKTRRQNVGWRQRVRRPSAKWRAWARTDRRAVRPE